VIIAVGGEQERVLAATVDAEAVDAWRRDFPALRDAHWKDAAVAKGMIGFT
jgi:predicted amidohydrolase